MISKKINELKKQKKLTNQKLSEISGVPLGTLNKITSGVTTDPKLETLKSLAKALECSLDDFETLDTLNLKELSQDKKELLNNYDKLNTQGKEKAIERVEELTQISKYTLEEENPVDDELNITEIEEVKLFDLPVSAGTGTQLLNDVSYELITIDRRFYPKADFALRVSGDSMEPRFYDGDIIYIKSTNDIDNGKIGIFYYNDEAYLKKLEKENGNICLISLNEKYPPIKVTNNSFKVVGIVL